MSVTYGFYNSLNGDRKYNARQVSSIFDGIINDGVYMSIGTSLMVTEYNGGASMMVDVGIGRAWFNHTWTLNDAILPLEVPQSELLLDRIDAVVLEVNETEESRANSIKIVSGVPASSPSRPVLVNAGEVHQYPLAYIYVAKNVTKITQANITNMVGTSSTPFVTGIIETIDAKSLLMQWQKQWDEFLEGSENSWDDWFVSFKNQNSAAIAAWLSSEQADFTEWFQGLQDMLEPDVAARLASQILDLTGRVTTLESCCQTLADYQMMLYSLDDSNSDVMIDSDGNEMQGRIIYAIR